ncbi:MAG: DinB family protein [Candidatus Korobacteraceae bacterium]
MKRLAIATIMLALATAALAQSKAPDQTTSNPVVSTVRQMEGRQAKNLIGAAEEMPADKYGYRPTPEQMTFAHLVMHSAQANNAFCAGIAGEPAREMKLSESDSKETLTKALKDSFTYCEQVLAKADDSALGQSVTLFEGQTATRASALVRLAASWADHYSAAAMYLRLNNLLPPSAKKPAGK